MQAVDLSFIPEELKERVVTDEDKLVEIEKAIMDAITEMKVASAAEDDFGRAEARDKVKRLKKEKKALKKAIEEKANAGSVDTAKIDELKAKIADALARQEKAMLDDDDDAEEAAEAEITELSKQLKALKGGSNIPKQNLEDARKKDEEINA